MKFEPDLLSLLSLREVQKLARVTQQSSILIRDFLVSHLVLSPQTNEAPLIKTVRVTGGRCSHTSGRWVATSICKLRGGGPSFSELRSHLTWSLWASTVTSHDLSFPHKTGAVW